MAKDEKGNLEFTSKNFNAKTHKKTYSIDEVVEQKHTLIGKPVEIEGKLLAYKIGEWGFFNDDVKIELAGNKYEIQVYGKVSRLHKEHKILHPYLKDFLGKTIEAVILPKDYFHIKKLDFNGKCFNFIIL